MTEQSQKKFVMPPFWNLVWQSRKIWQEWGMISHRISQMFHYAEYESVKRGLRQCDVYHVQANNFDNQLKKIFDDELVWQPILRSHSYDGGGHIHYPAEEIDQNTFIYGVVARTLEDALEFREAGLLGQVDHRVTGLMLGYPECCVEWFIEAWIEDGDPDPMYKTALSTKSHEVNEDGSVTVYGEPEYNRLIRYFGYQVVPYFMHSFDCEDSKDFYTPWLEIMREFDEEALEKLIEILSMPVTWSNANMIVKVDHPLFRGAANGVDQPASVVHWRSENE